MRRESLSDAAIFTPILRPRGTCCCLHAPVDAFQSALPTTMLFDYLPHGRNRQKKRRHLPMRIRSLAALLVLALFCVALGNRAPARADAEKKNVTAEIKSLKA